MFEIFAGLGVLYLIYVIIAAMISIMAWVVLGALSVVGVMVGLFVWLLISIGDGVSKSIQRRRAPLAGGRWH